MITIWIDDYIVVMVCVNQYCLDTFACLECDTNLIMLINRTWLINMLNSTKSNASRLLSPLILLKHLHV
jgi:hypothetical protein